MNSLVGILTATTAGNALSLAGQAAKTVAAPFQSLLNAAIERQQTGEVAGQAADEAATAALLSERVAERLQQILDDAGVRPDEPIELRIDAPSGEVTVANHHPLAAAIESAIQDDESLRADLLQLSREEGIGSFSNQFQEASLLKIQMNDDESTVSMNWL